MLQPETGGRRLSDLVFFETREEVSWAARGGLPMGAASWVALTAEAAQALEQQDVPYTAASDHADLTCLSASQDEFNRRTFQIACSLEEYIASRYPPARFDGPGFISSQGYTLQYSAASIATRTLLMHNAIRSIHPKSVFVFRGSILPWFEGSGYDVNPWIPLIQNLAAQSNTKFEWLKNPVNSPRYQLVKQQCFTQVSHRLRAFYRGFSQCLMEIKNALRPKSVRLLFMGGVRYDWEPLISELTESEHYILDGKTTDSHGWDFHYEPELKSPAGRLLKRLKINPVEKTPEEDKTISTYFEEWKKKNNNTLLVPGTGLDLCPALLPQYRAMALLGPALVRHSDMLANSVVNEIGPHMACTVGMTDIASKRLAHIFRKYSIPTVCYQNGGVFGTHVSPGLDQIGPGYSDYFLTYGPGVLPSPRPVIPKTAQFVPIGSARVETWIKSKHFLDQSFLRTKFTILWLSEATTANTLGGCFQYEDVKRYRLQKNALNMLCSQRDIKIIFRLFPRDVKKNGIPTRVEEEGLNIEIKTSGSTRKLIAISDLVIIDVHSNTSWNEVFAMKKPSILFCDPAYTGLLPHFVRDLEKTCCVCKSEDKFLQVIGRIIHDRKRLMSELKRYDPTHYILQYVLGDPDGKCVDRAISFIRKLCR
jgi:hypothetical protein